ncbi:ORF26 [Cydia pomonella granulovirus]|uniref:ORF26 n=1 Tax=Cydia pomonella granulosis virus (isolate Mexico/1963) TaxID=654905 RepID=Q91F27_GVCPM|nr:ORF26 [Cydia pomonella granulovirus]AAK70686.1 ORF26 [Cydia pomonella granulovirus]
MYVVVQTEYTLWLIFIINNVIIIFIINNVIIIFIFIFIFIINFIINNVIVIIIIIDLINHIVIIIIDLINHLPVHGRVMFLSLVGCKVTPLKHHQNVAQLCFSSSCIMPFSNKKHSGSCL